ncbi:MAG: hypothetical protein SFY69_10085 [Planctomycetota bacterium]|nr:hypothetical protein [Planctomycetota bacterium]
MGDRPRIAVWALAEQADFVRAVAAHAGADVAAAGSPSRGQSGQLAKALDAAPFDDLRAFATDADVSLVWIASPGDFGAGEDDADARWVLSLHQRGVRVASTEAVPASALIMKRSGWTAEGPDGAGQHLRFLGLSRAGTAWRDVLETLAAFGTPRALSVEAWAAPQQMSLGGRLFGAMDLVFAVLGEPETVDAAYVGPRTAAGLYAMPGETLHGLDGDILGTLRFADGRAAVLTASNSAGRWNTVITMISGEGRLRVFDDGWEWIAPDGSKRDEFRRASRGDAERADHAVGAVGGALARLLDPRAPDEGPVALEPILAMSQAALLSARTGQPESPATIRRLVSGT